MSNAQTVLRENFFKVAERVESLSGIIDPSVPESLTYAQKVLVQIVSDLTNMAAAGQQIDAATPGTESTLVGEIFGLLDQSKTLLSHIHRAVQIQSRLGSGETRAAQPQESYDEESDSDESDSDESDDEDSESESGADDAEGRRVDQLVAQNEADPLSREEIGKLLVLTSRAYKSQIISPNQRAFLKTQIIARHGMLRVVLQFPSLESIMAALKTISSSVDG